VPAQQVVFIVTILLSGTNFSLEKHFSIYIYSLQICKCLHCVRLDISI